MLVPCPKYSSWLRPMLRVELVNDICELQTNGKKGKSMGEFGENEENFAEVELDEIFVGVELATAVGEVDIEDVEVGVGLAAAAA